MNIETPGRLRAYAAFVDEQPDPGVMPSAWRFIDGLPATQKLELMIKIIGESDLGNPDEGLREQAEIALLQLVEDSREADRREHIMISEGRPSLNPWAAPESGVWL